MPTRHRYKDKKRKGYYERGRAKGTGKYYTRHVSELENCCCCGFAFMAIVASAIAAMSFLVFAWRRVGSDKGQHGYTSSTFV